MTVVPKLPKNNARIVEILQKVIQHKRNVLSELPRADTPELKQRKQSMRFAIAALGRAVEEILALDFEVHKGEEVLNIRGIGKGTAKRIDEILQTGSLEELKDFKPRQRQSDLQDVFGLGPAAVQKLSERGISTVAELRSAITSGLVQMPDAVIQGILYHRDLKLRIPREEMNRYNRILNNIKSKLGRDIALDLCGSYRRRRPDCGDLDVLVTSAKDDPQQVQTLLKQFIEELAKRKLLVAHLGEGATKFTGIVMHPQIGIARRIDVRWVPYESYPTALMYFTGSKDFNVMMRRQAIKLGYKLSEYALSENSHVIPVRSERDIFDRLEIPYMAPERSMLTLSWCQLDQLLRNLIILDKNDLVNTEEFLTLQRSLTTSIRMLGDDVFEFSPANKQLLYPALTSNDCWLGGEYIYFPGIQEVFYGLIDMYEMLCNSTQLHQEYVVRLQLIQNGVAKMKAQNEVDEIDGLLSELVV